MANNNTNDQTGMELEFAEDVIDVDHDDFSPSDLTPVDEESPLHTPLGSADTSPSGGDKHHRLEAGVD
eukprot:CAMPEP_0172468752 /NCGR_PEP_ID=MMETSP1065-20121228/62033_1 /TAXON_ID=265537 /ORGANISM="Amphiprora paludosa, Strain CCMP125" /LENGTH=67 /DNA_ID=CAMNT_0013226211 /DNA_START=21 /DNA_END=221 /DNA_ORIENTATION=+